jgi:hypothetical protein
MKLDHAVLKPRATAEAARDAHVKPNARTRHAVGNAAQRETPVSTSGSNDGGDWLAERIETGAPSGAGTNGEETTKGLE